MFVRNRVMRWIAVALPLIVVSTVNAEPPADDPGVDFLRAAAPPALAEAMRPGLPVAVTFEGQSLAFAPVRPGVLEASVRDLTVQVHYGIESEHGAVWYEVVMINKGAAPVRGIQIEPFTARFVVDPPRIIPRVRYLSGSQHYDATYPSRAFELVERANMTNDHSKPIVIEGGYASRYVPMMQLGLQHGSTMSGLMVTFEWGPRWSLSAGYVKTHYTGGPTSDFELRAKLDLGDYAVRAGQTLRAPKIHVVYFEGERWTPLDNAGRRYIHDRLAWSKPPLARVSKVTYDHWFGIHSNFDMDDMMRQAKRAAELGCEYFCLDAGWYGKGAFGASGKGKWNEPDPVKFPGGVADVQRLSKFCRDNGMGFGLWAYLITKNGGGETPFDLATDEGVQGAVNQLSQWIETYDMTWFRFEMSGTGDLQYMNGYNRVLEEITRKYPDLHIECCSGGGQRFYPAMIRWCTSTWLSDHTADADVCRFNQAGALRFWPAHFLNLAVRVHRDSGDREATAYNFISRTVGAPSFNGDIAQWSDEATARMRRLVDAFKSVRHLQNQPVSFPLPQPRGLEDWDVICFGDGSGDGQLLYAFNIEGPADREVIVPSAPGEWGLVMASNDKVRIAGEGGQVRLHVPRRSCAVWKRVP